MKRNKQKTGPDAPVVVNYGRLCLYIPEELSKWVKDQAYAARLPVSGWMVKLLKRLKSRQVAPRSTTIPAP